MKKLFLLLGLCLLLLPLVQAGDQFIQNTNGNGAGVGPATFTNNAGTVFQPNETVVLKAVQLWGSATPTVLHITNYSNCAELGNDVFVGGAGGVANVDFTMYAGQKYFLGANSNGSQYNRQYSTAGSVPYNQSHGAWTDFTYNACVFDTTAYHNIMNITVETLDPPATYPYAELNLLDLYDSASLPDGTVCFIGTQSNTSVSGVCSIYNQTTGLNYSVGSTNYFTKTGTATENATEDVYLYGAFPLFSVLNVENATLTGFNLTSPETSNTTATSTANLLLPPNTTTSVNVTATDYYLLQNNYTSGSQDSSLYNFTGAYQTVLTINVTNAYTGAPLSNFTGYAYHNETDYNHSFVDDNGTAELNVLFGTYLLYADVSGYSLSEDNHKTETINESTQTITFSLYSENSIFFNFLDEDDGTPITSNITVIVSGGLYEETFYSATGSLFVENLTDGNYSVKFSGANYTQKTYEFTVADRSSQTLNAYLSRSTSTVTFTMINDNTFQTIEDASVSQQRILNGTWTTVGSKTSDITGRAQFVYTIGTKYRFSITKTGYTSKVFELDPIIFSSYNIQLTPTQVITEEYGLFDVTLFHYPKKFTEGEVNNLSVMFTSPSGSFISYGAVVSSPNGTSTQTGVNAYGDQLDFSFLLNNTVFTDRVNLTIFYQSVFGENKSYNYAYVIDGTFSNGTLVSPTTVDYGLGTVEKGLIATVVVVFGAGLVGLFSGAIFGLLAGLFLFGYFVFIAFISAWFVIPVIVIGVLLIMRDQNG